MKSNVILDLTAANDKRLGFIGRLTYEKGFDQFCKLAQLNKNKKSFIAAGEFDKK